MTYQVIKTINGRRYIYEQRTWREGKRVRTESRYVGPADGGPKRRRLARKIADFIKANMAPRHGLPDEEEMLKQYNARVAREQQARDALLGDLYDKYGLRLSDTPRPAVAPPQVVVAAPSVLQADAKESPSTEEGQGATDETPDAQNS